jgi:hypothetical protein
MTNDEGMTKSENAWTGEERFWNANELSVVRAVPELKSQARALWSEARELHLIFSKIRRTGA